MMATPTAAIAMDPWVATVVAPTAPALPVLPFFSVVLLPCFPFLFGCPFFALVDVEDDADSPASSRFCVLPTPLPLPMSTFGADVDVVAAAVVAAAVAGTVVGSVVVVTGTGVDDDIGDSTAIVGASPGRVLHVELGTPAPADDDTWTSYAYGSLMNPQLREPILM
jgi:hypothetical protein